VQQHIKEEKLHSRRALMEVEQFLRESEAKLAEERSSRLALADGLEQGLKKARLELDQECKQRVLAEAELAPKLQGLEEAVSGRARDHRAMELEVGRLARSVDVAMEELRGLREALATEASERRAGDDTGLDMLRDLRDTVLKENRERLALQEDQVRTHAAMVEQVRGDHLQAHGLLKDKVAALHKDLLPFREELPSLRTRLQEVEAKIGSGVKEHTKTLERELAERATQQQRLERRVADLAAAADKAHLERQTQAEDIEQHLKTFRSKLKGLVSEQAEAARLAREEMQAQLLDQVEREAAMREAQASTLLEQWSGHASAIEARVEAIEGGVRKVEERCRDVLSSDSQDWEAALQRQAEATGRQLREQGEGLQAQLAHERALREQQHEGTAEQLDFLDRFLQDIREVFLHKGTRSRMRMSTPGGTRGRELAPTPTAGKERPPSPASSTGRALGTA